MAWYLAKHRDTFTFIVMIHSLLVDFLCEIQHCLFLNFKNLKSTASPHQPPDTCQYQHFPSGKREADQYEGKK